MKASAIQKWLLETAEARLSELWREADAVRAAHVGDAVHLRGLIEISNYCARQCGYCGLRAPNRSLERYRMSADEILACARLAAELGYGTVVLQAGEDPGLAAEWVAEVVRRIKSETGRAVTLSLGEQDAETLALWRAAGADRYLLRFETSNVELFERIHPRGAGARAPGARHSERSEESGDEPACRQIPRCARNDVNCVPEPDNHPRLAMLRALRELDYEVGSGVMIGIPGQSYDDLVRDLELFRELDLDMIGVGPWLPHPQTPLGAGIEGTGIKGLRPELGQALNPLIPQSLNPSADQVPNTELMTYKVVALARLVCPRANIPSTTALATLNRAAGRELGLQRGANVVMPNLTPPGYRRLYEIYPAKACLYETAEQCHGCMMARIRGLGRTVGTGPGMSPNWLARHAGCAAAGREGPAAQSQQVVKP